MGRVEEKVKFINFLNLLGTNIFDLKPNNICFILGKIHFSEAIKNKYIQNKGGNWQSGRSSGWMDIEQRPILGLFLGQFWGKSILELICPDHSIYQSRK